MQQFLFFKRCFYKFSSTVLVFRSYLELYINHDQWMRLIFDSVNDVLRFKGSNTARPRFLSRHEVTDPKVWKVTLSFFLRRLIQWVFTIFVPFATKQQLKARYDANCVQHLGLRAALRSKRSEGSRLYRKVMLGRQETKGWGSGLHRKILRALGLQPPTQLGPCNMYCTIHLCSLCYVILFIINNYFLSILVQVGNS